VVAPTHAERWSIDPGVDPGGERLEIRLRGAFEVDDAHQLDAALAEHLQGMTPGAALVIIDLNDLARCSVAARDVLLEIQRRLSRVARRTAWVTNRPLNRGLGLFICHRSEDGNARTFPDLDHAEAWSETTETRPDALHRRAAQWFGRLVGAGREARA